MQLSPPQKKILLKIKKIHIIFAETYHFCSRFNWYATFVCKHTFYLATAWITTSKFIVNQFKSVLLRHKDTCRPPPVKTQQTFKPEEKKQPPWCSPSAHPLRWGRRPLSFSPVPLTGSGRPGVGVPTSCLLQPRSAPSSSWSVGCWAAAWTVRIPPIHKHQR